MNFQIEKDVVEQLHIQQETEVVYIIEGEAQATVMDKNYRLLKHSVLLFNAGVLHTLICSSPTVIARAVFTDKEIRNITNGENIIFDCSSTNDNGYSCDPAADIFRKLVDCKVFGQPRRNGIIYSLLYELLDCLIENYGISITGDEIRKFNDDERMQLILRDINQNFNENIHLSDLAKKLYVSSSTVSRLFKKYTGSYFKEYVKQIRLFHAVEQLLYTKDSMTKISMDCGFSNPSVFTHTFRSQYGMSPNKYRKIHIRTLKKDINDKKMQSEQLLRELSMKKPFNAETMETESVAVNINSCHGEFSGKICNETMNFGAAEHMIKANLQKHILYLKEKLGVRYVRLWNLFSKKLELTDGIHIGNYNYDILDSVLDFLVANNLYPFLEFGRRKSVALEFPNKTVYMQDEYIVFESREAWEAMFKDFLNHVIIRYGKEEVRQWKFELGKNRINGEECPCYIDEKYEYFNAYAYIWKTVKSVLPEISVGGPMGLCKFDLDFLKEFIIRCTEEGCLPDFITWASFPYESGSHGIEMIHRTDPPGIVEYETVKEIRSIIEKYMGTACPLYLTEWNFSVSSRNYLNDSCYRAVYFARLLCELHEDVDQLCVWVASDWISSYYDTVSIANGGNGILTKNMIPKPICLVMAFFKNMGKHLLARGDHYIITKTDNHELYMLCYNFSGYPSILLQNGENIEVPEKIVKDYNGQGSHIIEIHVDGLISGQTYMVKKRCLNEREGSILGIWETLGYERRLSPEDINYIRESCRPKLTIERYHCADGYMHLSVEVRRQEMIFIHAFAVV